ncbi:MAG TPA: 50S ribosomal protein L13 [Bacteroidia bacterium]|jgi:large subunit ribosomal protein L13|nr:50S ribosomal protein L13 [Bacteroidia bacterium]
MDTRSYTTKVSFEKDNKSWLIVDAENQTLGRLASKLAYLLRGKHKPSFTPHLDMGDNIIVINASKVRFTGNKLTDKVYVRHTGYPGGQRYSTPKTLLASKPEFIIERAVKKMLPQTRLGGQIIRNLHVYANDKHTHEAQQPKAVDLKSLLEKKSK